MIILVIPVVVDNIRYKTGTTPKTSDVAWEFRTSDYIGINYDPYSVVYYNLPNTTPAAPTGLQVEDTTNPTAVFTTYSSIDFTAYFNDADNGDLTDYCWIQISETQNDSDFWDSGSIAIDPACKEGTKCSVAYSGSNKFKHRTVYYWRIKFRDDDGKWSPWSDTSSTFVIDFNGNYRFCEAIHLGTDHDSIPAGYLLTLEHPTGLARTLATNAFKDEGIQYNSRHAMFQRWDQGGTKLFYTYLANAEQGSLQIYYGEVDITNRRYPDPKRLTIQALRTSYDSHSYPVCGSDSTDTTWIVWGGHGVNALWYTKSGDRKKWSALDSIVVTHATYPMFEADTSGDTIFIVYRSMKDVKDKDYQICWAKSNDRGNTWDIDTIIYSAAIEDVTDDTLRRLYLADFEIDPTNIIHVIFYWCTEKPMKTPIFGGKAVESRGMWYAQCRVSDSVWYHADGITVAGTTGHQYICADSAENLALSDTSMANYTEVSPIEIFCPLKGTGNYPGWIYISGGIKYDRTLNNMDSTDACIWWWNGYDWDSTNVSATVSGNYRMYYGRAGLGIATTHNRGDTLALYTIIGARADTAMNTNEWFSGEIIEFVSNDTTRSSWIARELSNGSAVGHGMLFVRRGSNPNHRVDIIFGQYRTIEYMTNNTYAYGLPSGDDWRIVVDDNEKDRVTTTRWGHWNTKILWKNHSLALPDSNGWVNSYVYLYHDYPNANEPKKNPFEIFSANPGENSFWESFNYPIGRLHYRNRWRCDGSIADIKIVSMPIEHSVHILQGNKAVFFNEPAVESYGAHFVDTDFQRVEVIANIMAIEVVSNSSVYLGLKDDTTTFKTGIRGGGTDWNFAYYNGSWTTGGSAYKTQYYEFRCIVDDDGVDVYINDSLYWSDINYVTKIDSITIGVDAGNRAYFDYIRVFPWRSNPPDLYILRNSNGKP